MKTFRDIVVVKQPVGGMWTTVRDRLPELAARLDDIETITVIEREQISPGKLRLLNEWRSTQRIPGLLQGALGTAEVSWLDRNEWDDAGHRCTWSIEPSILRGHIVCRGETSFAPAMGGRGARITFSGEFDIAPDALRRLAGPLASPLSTFAESIVSTIVPRNLRKVMDAAASQAAMGQ